MTKSNPTDPIQVIKERIVHGIFVVFCIIAIPALVVVFIRSQRIGWDYAVGFQFGIIAVAVVLLPFLNKLSKDFKAVYIVFGLLGVAFTAMHKLGFFAAGKIYLIPAVMIATLMLNRKLGYTVLLVYFVIYYIIAWLYLSGRIEYRLEPNVYVRETTVWATTGLVLLLNAAALLVIIDRYDVAYQKFLRSITAKEENYRTLFEEAAEGILITNPEGEILQINKNFSTLSSYPKDEITGTKVYTLFKDDKAGKGPCGPDLVSEGQENLLVRKLLKKGGSTTEVEIRCLELSDGRMQIFVSDISERTLAERKLRESEQQFKTLFENSSDAIILLKGFIVFDCNPRTLELFNCSYEEMIGSSPTPFSPEYQPDGRRSDMVIAERTEKVLKGIPQIFEWKHCTIDQVSFDAEVSLNKVILNDEVIIQAIVRDLTERKQLNRKLYMASVDAEENERERLARELHDGLGPLLSTSKIYLHNMRDIEDSQESEAFAIKLEQTLDEALEGIKEIANNISPHILRNFGVFEAISNYAKRLGVLLPVKIESSMDQSSRFPELLEITIYRIVCELLHNSLKHAEASSISIQMEEVNERFLLTYVDDGKGFDFEEMRKNKDGHGLLNIQSRIDSLNGQYSFVSKPGEGVRVIFEIPVN